MSSAIRFVVNGRQTAVEADDDRLLLWALRGELGLTGAKYGCGSGACGACTVLVGGKAVRACQVQLRQVAGQEVLTIEGLAQGGQLHPLQQAFIDHGALQCGYCTPGMLMNAYALLQQQRKPSRAQIAAAMEHHLCRCGAYQRILDAIESAAGAAGGPS
jgi:aerobic-type carbon monoxide dehydrogenase small subunit (CoxS/CutS family)